MIEHDSKLASALAYLGERWVLHPKHAPKKGRYNSQGLLVVPEVPEFLRELPAILRRQAL